MIKDASALSRSECFLDDVPMADWDRLGKVVIARRVNLGYNTQGEFATLLRVSSRLVGDIENGRRSNYDPATIARLERALSWETGSVERILEGGEPAPLRRLVDDAGSSDSALITIQRPDGGPDEIDLIYASTTMTAEEKLLRIRQVLQLRAQAEAHERQRQEAHDRA